MTARKNLRYLLIAAVLPLTLTACGGKHTAASSSASSEAHAIATSSADQQAAKDVVGNCINTTSLGAVVNSLDTKAKEKKAEKCMDIPPGNMPAFKSAVTTSAVATYNQNSAAVKTKHTTWKKVFENWGTTQLPLIVKKYQAS
jgi:hypothetical protein